MKTIKDKIFQAERDLYNQIDLKLVNCRFEGEEDGESALKECKNITLYDCFMNLRYPLWHDDYVLLDHVEQSPNCRASIWYSNNVTINDSKLNGIKAVRECKNISLNNTIVDSLEFGWKSEFIKIDNCNINSQYVLFLSKNIKAKNSTFSGKYGFQYMENVEFDGCSFDTKDAFWHGKNIIARNCIIKGEYLGWYSENLTLIDCKIIGIQPLCYCKKLKLVNCEMVDANLAFEYSDVEATINGNVDSIKNPLSGHIKVDSVDEILITKDSIYKSEATIEVNSLIKE